MTLAILPSYDKQCILVDLFLLEYHLSFQDYLLASRAMSLE